MTVKYFMRLLSEEYQKDVSSQNVKKTIRALYENPKLIQALTGSLKSDEYFKEMNIINDIMKTFEGRNQALIKEYWMVVESR